MSTTNNNEQGSVVLSGLEIAGVNMERLMSNLDETSYNEGSEALACRLSDCREVIKSLLAKAAQPAAGLVPEGWKRALHAAVAALYFDDSADFRSALGSVVRYLDAELAGVMLGSPKAAYDKVCAMLVAAPVPPVHADEQPVELADQILQLNSKPNDAWGVQKQIGYEEGYFDAKCAAAKLARAAHLARQAQAGAVAEFEYELVQDDMVVAATSGPSAWREIKHYAAQYEQDGPVEIIEVARKKVSAPTLGSAQAAQADTVDTDRLNWLANAYRDQHPHAPYFDSGYWRVPYLVSGDGGMGGGVSEATFPTLREAIDTARTFNTPADDSQPAVGGA